MGSRLRCHPWFRTPSQTARFLFDLANDPPARKMWLDPRLLHFNRSGEQISMLEWTMLFEDRAYRVVEQTQVEQALISTIWLGIDHGFGARGEDQPLQFETMVLPDTEFQARYRTEVEARAGHAATVEAVKVAHGIAVELVR